MATYKPKTYRDNDGDRQVIANGGTLILLDGATLKMGTGEDVTLSFDGTTLNITGLPTDDPGVAGALWNDSGDIAISAG